MSTTVTTTATATGEPIRPAAGVPLPWLVSAGTPGALRAQAAKLLAYVEARPGLDLAAAALTLATARTPLAYRAMIAGTERATLLDGLTALASRPDASAPGVFTASVRSTAVSAFLFSGQGSQRLGMGRELHARFPVFAEAFDAVCAGLDEHLNEYPDRPVRDVVWGEDAELLNRTVHAQAGLFAVEVALYRLAESFGIRADFVAGHSIGEVAAAHVAGVFSLADACRLVAARGRLMQALPEGGAMVALQATEAEVLPLLGDQVSLAAVNGPRAVVVSG
ncbi:acyltransferase domain-containing protein, partial [Streptomyces sp. NPDC058548]|uniref:acyltransferase domain-containing protein n=1 Tax=Streptomyces sp. NPDC058548 TaxID=3346545 RepID=UPI003651E6FD